MNYISDILYLISTGLLVPVVVLPIIFFGRALLLVGVFFSDSIWPSVARRHFWTRNWTG